MDETSRIVAWLREQAEYYDGLTKSAHDGTVAGCFAFARIAFLGAANEIACGTHLKDTQHER